MENEESSMPPMEGTASFEANMYAEMDRIGMLEEYLSRLDKRLEEEDKRAVAVAEEDQRMQEEEEAHTRRYRAVVLNETPTELMDESNFEIVLANAYIDEELEVSWKVETVLARKKHGNVVYYKVKWEKRNFVTWEKEGDIENVAAIEKYERLVKVLSEAPRSTRRRPVSYITKRRMRSDPKLKEKMAQRPDMQFNAVWSCEVERDIWIPYCDQNQQRIEGAYRGLQDEVQINVNGSHYIIHFGLMRQQGGVGSRLVQRVAQVPVEEERRRLAEMSVGQLRQYIQSLPDLSAVHYDALVRLHEVDKVVVTASTADIRSLHHTSFGKLLEMIADGTDVPAFSEECLVCLEDYKTDDRIIQLPFCGHYFHQTCAMDYFEQYSKYCPVCKAPLTST